MPMASRLRVLLSACAFAALAVAFVHERAGHAHAEHRGAAVAALAQGAPAPSAPAQAPAASPAQQGAQPPRGRDQAQSAPASGERIWTERNSSAAPIVQLPSFSKLTSMVTPTVVAIQVQEKVARGSAGGVVPFDPFDFGMPPGHPGGGVPAKGLGSGFVIRGDGLILTNAHVVEDASDIEVTVGDGGTQKTVKAKVLGTADVYDVALIQTVEKLDAPVVPLGNSDEVQVGDWVLAVGNPFGLSHSASVGIISAKQRRELAPSGREGLYDFLQTDASINPGNSGGPLVNMKGEVIGINAAVNAVGQGIGFAIPINLAKSVLPQLKTKGSFSRSWIGVRIQPLTPELAQTYGLKEPRGALVADVVPSSPASKAGLQDGDIILRFDGKDITRASDLPLYASMAGVGKTVPLEVLHEGQRRDLQIKLGSYPKEQTAENEGGGGAPKPKGTGVGKIGMTLSDLTPEIKQDLGVNVSAGAVVVDVTPGSAADQAGLREGDVIVRAGGQQVQSAADLAKRLQGMRPGEVVRLQVQREGGRLYIALRAAQG